MKSLEFIYWLQGAFEVGEVTSLDETQIQTIKNHLAMAELTDKNNTHHFCNWLKGYFDGLDTNALTVEQVDKIKNKLNNCFQHEVPPITPPKNNFNDELIRC